MPTNEAKIILKKVLLSFTAIDERKTGKCRRFRYLVIPGNNTTRWIVPENSKYAHKVMSQWQPYGTVSLIKWYAVRLLYRLQLLKLLPVIRTITDDTGKELYIPNTQTEVMPVIYVGTPGNQQKAVVTVVDINTAKSLAVIKVAIAEAAVHCLLREAKILTQLAKLNVINIPKILYKNVYNQSTWQSVLDGSPTSRKLTKNHVDWLLQLPKYIELSSFGEQARKLHQLMSITSELFSSEQKQLLIKAIESIENNIDIPLVLVHGDFAPWNIKKSTDHKLLIMDWEDSSFNGLPLWDLCHFYIIQEYLFNDIKSFQLMRSCKLIHYYVESIGITHLSKSMLYILYCLYQILDGKNVSEKYKGFLFHKIRMVIEE